MLVICPQNDGNGEMIGYCNRGAGSKASRRLMCFYTIEDENTVGDQDEHSWQWLCWQYHSAQCAFWVLRWPCGQKLKSKNTLF